MAVSGVTGLAVLDLAGNVGMKVATTGTCPDWYTNASVAVGTSTSRYGGVFIVTSPTP